MDDRWNLDRFVEAQDEFDTYRHALQQLADGRKRGHWMWFIFPQLAGLGRSPTSRHFAISGLDEARTYLAHPVLGPRLRQCVRQLAELENADADAIFGEVDAMKLRSSLTLFARADPDDTLFDETLRRYFTSPDSLTLRLLGS